MSGAETDTNTVRDALVVGDHVIYVVKNRWGEKTDDGCPLRITRATPHGWMATRTVPEEWEEPGFEWLVTRPQFDDGRYRKLTREEAQAYEALALYKGVGS